MTGTKVAAVQGPNYKIAKDAYVGKTIRITKGKHALDFYWSINVIFSFYVI